MSGVNPKYNLLFLFALFIIGLVSVYDNTLTYIYSDFINHMEQNFLGTLLLKLGGPSLFITSKGLGTIIVILLSLALIKTKYRVALIPVLAFQIALFFYLTFDPFPPNTGNNIEQNVVSPFMEVISFYTNSLK